MHPLHPLQDDFLQVASAPSPMNNMNMNGVATMEASAGGTSSDTGSNSLHASSVSSSMHPMNQHQHHNGIMGASNPGIPSSNNMNAAVSLDVFKAQTSRFANSFATFAQRAASQVVGSPAAEHATYPSPYSHSSGAPMLHHQTTPTNGSTDSTTPTAGQGPAGGTGLPLQPHMMVPVDLDNDQKATLIQTHVGDLWPGERVIMFLSNLLHVSDSRLQFQYSYQAQQQSAATSSSMWCCAMTYYRLILFSTAHPAGSSGSVGGSSSSLGMTSSPPADWNAACWPPSANHGGPHVLEMPLARYVQCAVLCYFDFDSFLDIVALFSVLFVAFGSRTKQSIHSLSFCSFDRLLT
jgi:hypothetical protein